MYTVVRCELGRTRPPTRCSPRICSLGRRQMPSHRLSNALDLGMAERGLLRSFVAGFDGTRERELICQIIMMALMSDGPPDTPGLNRLAHALQSRPELDGTDLG